MRNIPAPLQTKLDSGTTSLCWCWRVERSDGLVLGFTDHDRDLTFGGVTYRAGSGLSGSDLRQNVGLNVDNADISGALTSDALTPGDLGNGLFDNAEIKVYRVDWSAPADRLLVKRGQIGEVVRGPDGFSAEVRGLSHILQQQSGRVFQFGCDADLGDARCKVDLDTGPFKDTGSVIEVESARTFRVTGLGTHAAGWFTEGRLSWTSGANKGAALEIRRHDIVGGDVTLETWHDFHATVALGDAFTVTAGCDKSFETCKNKFSNALNYQGFPHMPGNDFVLSVGDSQDDETTGSLR